MEQYRDLNNRLYSLIHKEVGKKNSDEDFDKLWGEIRTNSEALEWAIEPKKEERSGLDTLNGLTIAEMMLEYDYDVDKKLTQKLVDLIYYNKHIARIGVNDEAYIPTFLIKTLYNPYRKLTTAQKVYAVNEAMLQEGTLREEVRLTNDGGNNSKIIYGGIYKLYNERGIHGKWPYDIRYYILINDNWSEEEKKELVHNFWLNDDDYKKTIEEWEKRAEDDEYELEFCDKMRQLRPIKKEKANVKTKTKTTN